MAMELPRPNSGCSLSLENFFPRSLIFVVARDIFLSINSIFSIRPLNGPYNLFLASKPIFIWYTISFITLCFPYFPYHSDFLSSPRRFSFFLLPRLTLSFHHQTFLYTSTSTYLKSCFKPTSCCRISESVTVWDTEMDEQLCL